MVADPFAGPRARIRSARLHIQTLKTQEQAFFGSGAFQWHQEQVSGVWINKIVQTQDLPEAIAFAAWDGIQNLRASLDLAVCATAVAAGDENLKNTYFHFASSEAEWEKSFKGRTKAAPAFAVDVMRGFKPWGSGNDPLYALAKVSAVERHQLVRPMLLENNSIVLRANVVMNGPGPMRLGTRGWDSVRRELVISETGYPVPIPMEGYAFTTFLAFGDLDLVARKPIIPILDSLANVCGEVIDALEKGSGASAA
jgi:hypothetical protein